MMSSTTIDADQLRDALFFSREAGTGLSRLHGMAESPTSQAYWDGFAHAMNLALRGVNGSTGINRGGISPDTLIEAGNLAWQHHDQIERYDSGIVDEVDPDAPVDVVLDIRNAAEEIDRFGDVLPEYRYDLMTGKVYRHDPPESPEEKRAGEVRDFAFDAISKSRGPVFVTIAYHDRNNGSLVTKGYTWHPPSVRNQGSGGWMTQTMIVNGGISDPTGY